MTRPGAKLRISGAQHEQLMAHLFPGDGLEAAAILICSRFGAERAIYVVRDLLLVPHDSCPLRTPHRLIWPGQALEEAVDMAEPAGETLFLAHSHPGGLRAFSQLDEDSDRAVIPGLFEAIDVAHGTAVVTPDGAILARTYDRSGAQDIDLVVVAGDDIRFCWREHGQAPMSRPLAFTADMTGELNRLTAFVVGVSGTGSVIAEQVYRMGFGEVGLVDPDRVEFKNLNRILNATSADASEGALKVAMFAGAARRYAPSAASQVHASSILDRDVVLAASEADVVFCCVDSHHGRQVCDLIAAAFGIPLFDMGVQIPVGRTPNGGQRIAGVFARIDYVQPGGSSLEDREVYSARSLAEEYLREAAPGQHAAEVREGYMRGRAEEAPSVIALNMQAASAAMMEFVARAYPFRDAPNRRFARSLFDIGSSEAEYSSEDDFARATNPLAGTGAREPLLGIPALNRRRHAVA